MFHAIDLEAIELRRGARLPLDHPTWRVPCGSLANSMAKSI
jgi:hypothetical protein